VLDISIKSVDKAITSKKKASDFVRTPFRVLEKIDGTKLTLIRNDEPFNPEDYTKNWIVSYKGRIIYPTEFISLTHLVRLSISLCMIISKKFIPRLVESHTILSSLLSSFKINLRLQEITM